MAGLGRILTLALAVIAALGLAEARAQSRCLPPDSLAPGRIAWLTRLLTSEDSQFTADRHQFGIRRVANPVSVDSSARRPVGPSAQRSRNPELVVPVFSDSLCALAVHLVDSLWALPHRRAAVFVYRLGPAHYGVEDPSFPIAHSDWDRVVWIFTAGWHYLGGAGVHRPPSPRP